MRRTAWGLLAMFVSFLLGVVISGGSLLSMGGKLDTATLNAQPLSAPTLLVACLDPLAILLEIVAIVLIVWDSRQVEGLHRRLALVALVCFVIWGLANVGGFLPLSFVGMQRGSLSMVLAGQMVKAVAGLLQYAVPALLVYGLAPRSMRPFLWLALALTVVGNFATVVLSISGMQLDPIDASGQTMYAPRFEVDYRAGPYPLLLTLGWTGGLLYMVLYAILAWQSWKALRAAGGAGGRVEGPEGAPDES